MIYVIKHRNSDHVLFKQNSDNKNTTFVTSLKRVSTKLSSPAIQQAKISQQSEMSVIINQLNAVCFYLYLYFPWLKLRLRETIFHWQHSPRKQFVETHLKKMKE